MLPTLHERTNYGSSTGPFDSISAPKNGWNRVYSDRICFLSHPSIWNRCEDGTYIVNALRSFPVEGHQHSRRDVMGDKGGKKDKEKGQKQKSEKQKENAKNKQEKQPKKKI